MPNRDNPFPVFGMREPRKPGTPVDIAECRSDSATLVYALPKELLDALTSTLGTAAFDSARLEQEYRLSTDLGRGNVGAWGHWTVSYPYFRRENLGSAIDVTEIAAGSADKSEQIRIELALKKAETRLNSFWEVSRGYLGFLMTSNEFLLEHDGLVDKYGGDLDDKGLPVLMRPVISVTNVGCQLEPDILAFCTKWRLSGLAAPNLPIPLQPQAPVPAPIVALGEQDNCGSLLFMPDTFPIPSRDELRNILEDSRRGSIAGAKHLAEWNKLVDARNFAKSRITRFGRLFELQHYVRILEQRLCGALKRRRDSMKEAFAKFFDSSGSAVKSDLQEIRARLGEGWETRRCRFECVIDP